MKLIKYIKNTHKKLMILMYFWVSFGFVYARSFKEFVYSEVLPIIDQATKVLIAVAIVILFYNIMKTTWGDVGGEAFKKLSSKIFWGIFIVFIMVSIWGILALLRNILVSGL